MSTTQAVKEMEPSVTDLINKLRSLPSSQRLSPELIEFAYGLAFNYYSQGQYEAALHYFGFLTVYRPAEPRFLKGLALTHQQLGNYGEAIQLYSLAGMVDPLSPEHTLGVAECQLLSHQTEAAAGTLDLVIKFCKENGRHETVALRAEALKSLIAKQGGA